MGPRTSRNPLAFTACPVTLLMVVTYVAIFTALLYTHNVLPSAPNEAAPRRGLNLTEAWIDLDRITDGYHPYNSRRNDRVREYLLQRIDVILEENIPKRKARPGYRPEQSLPHFTNTTEPNAVMIFMDMQSNITSALGWDLSTTVDTAVYFEGTNIIVYIRGLNDDREDWWLQDANSIGRDHGAKKRGVLVNAHYDSVSTGFGATDDGVGVVSVLQLIRYFTTPGNRPKRGIVALLNNGEEDGLNGAKAFTQHPIAKFPDTFLNLEGAGAGGRALLFRSTDYEVTRFYKDSPYPFGTVVSADGFKRGFVRSGTDYSVFTAELGLRGLDVAFFEPRARYHTSEDAARRTSRDSLWHMLSAAVMTLEKMTSDTSTDFGAGAGFPAVWFDLFGRVFALIQLRSMFAISVSLLVVAPIILLALVAILRATGKYYLFATTAGTDPLDPYAPDEEVKLDLGGWRGVFRYPTAFILASAAVTALALLLTRFNPAIVYSSQYSVWCMLLSTWILVSWFILRGADYMRPSALHRAHALGWLFAGAWCVLVVATIAENNYDIAGGYLITIYFVSITVALLLSYLEFFRLSSRTNFVQIASQVNEDLRPHSISGRSGRPVSVNSNIEDEQRTNGRFENDSQYVDESTSLIRGRARQTARGRRRVQYSAAPSIGSPRLRLQTTKIQPAYGDEQSWSGPLPSWMWSIQFLVLASINVLLVGQVALFVTSALHQTLADGSPAMNIYIIFAILTVLLCIPVSPFLHRMSSLIPAVLFLVLIGTLIYNLFAFPFSEQNRLKVFFKQDTDLDSAINQVSLTGLDGFVQLVVADLPSTQGQAVKCAATATSARKGLTTCSWHGLAPNVVPSGSLLHQVPTLPVMSQQDYRAWMNISVQRGHESDGQARLDIFGNNTRACKLVFDIPVSKYSVRGAAVPDTRFNEAGIRELRLWHREWNKPWSVHVEWDNGNGKTDLSGRALCLWSDSNEQGAIPALDEIRRYIPVWAAITKFGDGLVEGSKQFSVST